ncbi:MAG: hypothetical protein HZT42_06135 [Paracoccaceae bacterium]|nr:MAG: hypothetical protein HZT42_06135 [Paracoccaceae bacterium]
MYFILGTVSRTEFEILRETTEMMKDNLEKNIDWFYSSLAIMIAVTGFGILLSFKKQFEMEWRKVLKKQTRVLKNLLMKDNQLGL